jgi:hypothetical protein
MDRLLRAGRLDALRVPGQHTQRAEAGILCDAYGTNRPWRANSVFGEVLITPSDPPSST